MLEKFFANKKVWIPVVAVVVLIIALLVGLFIAKNTGEDAGKGKDDITVDGNKNDSDDKNDAKPNEDGLTEVEQEDSNIESEAEDTVQTPSSWDGSGNGNSGNGDTNNNDNQNNQDDQNNDGMSTEGEAKDPDDVKFGNVF